MSACLFNEIKYNCHEPRATSHEPRATSHEPRAITCVTVAYNAEHTLRRAILSVLNQTYTDIEYILVDNASIDGTRKIIEEYAAKDTRIRAVYSDSNDMTCGGSPWIYRIAGVLDEGYFTTLDADDEYKLNAFETMIGFAAANSLDIACCGSDYVDAVSGDVRSRLYLSDNLLLRNANDFSQNLPAYHQFFRTHWGKVVRADILKRCDWSWLGTDVASDSRYAWECLKHSSRVGVLGGTLHKWYLSGTSASYRPHYSREGHADARILSCRRMYYLERDVLAAKCGAVSPRNSRFLLLAYMWDIKGTSEAVLSFPISLSKKLGAMLDIFMRVPTLKLAALLALKFPGYLAKKLFR